MVPSVSTEAQSLRTTEETIQPNNKAPRRIHIIWFFCFFCDDGTCNKEKGVRREYKEREAVGLDSGGYSLIRYIGMCRPEGYGYGAVLA